MNATSRDPHHTGIIAVAIACAVAMSGATQVGAATPALVTRITAAQTATNVQISVVASAPVEYQFLNVQPNWIVFQVTPAELQIRPGTLPYTGGVVKKIRVGQFAPQVVRVVVEMARPTPFRVIPAHDELALLVGVPGETQGSPSTGRTLPNAASASGSQGVLIPSAATATPTRAPQVPPLERLHAVLPGEGIGPVRLGMRIQDVLAAVGPAKSTQALPDGTRYEWFAPPANSGIGVRATPSGVVYRVWVLNDDQYAIADRVRIGTTETDARAVLGTPSEVLVDASSGTKTLTYPSLGLWLTIQMDQRYTFYGRIFEFGVTKPASPTPGR